MCLAVNESTYVGQDDAWANHTSIMLKTDEDVCNGFRQHTM